MKRYIDHSCPHCQRKLRVRAEYHRKILKCTHCSGMFTFKVHAAESSPFPPPHADYSGGSSGEPVLSGTAVTMLEEGIQEVVEQEAEQLQTRLQQLEQSFASALAECDTAKDGRASALRLIWTNWEEQKNAFQGLLEQQRQEFLREAEKHLTEQQARASADWQALKEHFENAQRQIEVERVTLQEEVTRLREETRILCQERDRLVSRASAAETTRRDTEQRLQAEITELRQVLEEVRQQEGASRSLHLQASEQSQILCAQVEESRSRIAEQDQQLATLRQELKAVRLEAGDKQEHLERQLEILEKQAETQKQEQERQLRDVRNQFDSDRAEFQREAERLRAERDGLAAQGEQLDVSLQAAQEEIARLRKEIVAADQEQNALRRQIEGLIQERDHLTTLRDELDISRRQFEEQMQLEMAALTQVLEQTRHKEEATSRLYRELSEQMQALRDTCEQERQQDAERQRRLADLEKELELARAEALLEQERRRAAWTEEQSRAATGRQKLEQELADVRSECSLHVNDINQLRGEAATLQSEREILKGQLSQAEQLKQEAHAEQKRLVALLAQERHLRESVERRCQNLQAQVQKLEAEVVEISRDSQSALTLHQELESTRAERKRIMQVLAEQQAVAAADCQKWQEELDTLRMHFEQDRVSLQAEADRCSQEAAALREERDAALEQIGALRQEWAVLSSQREHLESALQERKQWCENQTAFLTEEVNRVRREAEAAAQHNQELEEERARVRRDQGQHQNGFTAPPASATLEKELEALKTEHDRLQVTLSDEQARAAVEREKLLKQMQEAENQFNQDRAALQSAAVWFRQEATHFRQILRNMGVHGL